MTGGILNNCGLTVHITVRSGAGGVPNQIWGVGVRWGLGVGGIGQIRLMAWKA